MTCYNISFPISSEGHRAPVFITFLSYSNRRNGVLAHVRTVMPTLRPSVPCPLALSNGISCPSDPRYRIPTPPSSGCSAGSSGTAWSSRWIRRSPLSRPYRVCPPAPLFSPGRSGSPPPVRATSVSVRGRRNRQSREEGLRRHHIAHIHEHGEELPARPCDMRRGLPVRDHSVAHSRRGPAHRAPRAGGGRGAEAEEEK